MKQEDGPLGLLVGQMIRRTLRARFRAGYVSGPKPSPAGPPVIFVANHHGWHDGYVMYALIKHLGIVASDWVAELAEFPLFAKIGALPFPPDDEKTRFATIRTTVRQMNEGRSLILFAEGTLHRPPEVWPLGSALEFLIRKVPGVRVVPVALHYDMSIHERPEVFVELADEVVSPSAEDVRSTLVELLKSAPGRIEDSNRWDVLFEGTKDVNERWGMKSRKKR